MIDYKTVNSFVGRPWVYLEFDCWALVKDASKKLFNIEINDKVSFSDKPDPAHNTEEFNRHKNDAKWSKVNDTQPGDVILFFNRSGNPVHVGIYIEKGNVLHCHGGAGVKNGKARYDSLNLIKSIYPKHETYRYANNSN